MNPITLFLALVLVLAGLATGEFVSVWLAPLFLIAAVLVLLSVKVANALAIAGRDLPGAEVKPLIKTAA
jgi:hypothetical protein